MDEDTPDHTSSDRHEGFSNVAGMELEIEEDNLDDIPDELIKGEEELSLEDLIQELEATTRTMDDNKEPVSYTHLDVYKRQVMKGCWN